jgi:uncharacterized membrane protein YfcA
MLLPLPFPDAHLAVLAAVAALSAGLLTTLAGIGGGQVLLIALALLYDPINALTVTGPALLLGNGHRLFVMRRAVPWRTIAPFLLGALPGAVLGGGLAAFIPEDGLRVAMVVMALLAGIKVLAGWSWTPPPGALTPGGAFTGVLAATGGGAGLVAGPMLLSTGLTGRAYVSGIAMCSVTMHVGRMAAYGASGWVTTGTFATGGVLALCIVLGNLVGLRARDHVPERWGSASFWRSRTWCDAFTDPQVHHGVRPRPLGAPRR